LSVIFLVSLSACAKKQAADSPAVDTEATSEQTAPEVIESNSDQGSIEEGEIKMPVLEDVFFDYDSAALSGAAKRTLENNAGQLKDADANVTIEGHCDERGTIAYNLALGERRAKAAKDYLVSLGVSANRLKIISYGKERPFDPGHTESAWSKNRRAHFVGDR
jgi:peptidoglycan-associated lipoprotein